MKNYPVTRTDHKTEATAILCAPVDVGILPLVLWVNSFHTIMTRWCCEGEFRKKRKSLRSRGYSLPYITIWVEEDSFELKKVVSKLASSAKIEPICTDGEVHVWNIVFNSKSAMKRIQKKLGIGEG